MLLLWFFAELLLLDCHMMWFLYSEANTKQFLLSCDTTTIFYIQGWHVMWYIEEENRPLPKSSPVGISLKMESHSCMHKVVLNDRILLSAISSFLVCPVQMRKKKLFVTFFRFSGKFFCILGYTVLLLCIRLHMNCTFWRKCHAHGQKK